MACKYVITSLGKEHVFDSKDALLKFVRERDILEGINTKGKPEMTTQTLANVLRQVAFNENNYDPGELRKFQADLLDQFIQLESQAGFFYKIGPAIALTKGLGKSFEQMDNIAKNMKDLGIGGEMDESVPFDVRYLLTGNPEYKAENSDQYYHKITANNLKIMNEISALSKTMFMERTPAFMEVVNRVAENLKNSIGGDQINDLKNELSSFSQIAAYKQWIAANDKKTSTLRNSLIYDKSDIKGIVDIVREAKELAPANTFLSFILPVSTSVKIGKKQQKNILNRDLINTIEGRTRGKIEPDLVASLMDSFSELYNNPHTQYHAKALFDYLIVKDGLQFKNKSFIKMLPTVMFKEMSDATDIATKLMASNNTVEYKNLLKSLAARELVDSEGNIVNYFSDKEKANFNSLFKSGDVRAIRDELYKKVFGLGYDEMYDKFENIYATDVNNQFNLSYVRPTISKGKRAKAINFEDAGKVMNINLFDEKHKAMRGTEEGNKYLSDRINELAEAGFDSTSEEGKNKEGENVNKLGIQFKKYIQVQGSKEKKLFKLDSVYRDGKVHQGLDMTKEGENIPSGISARYVAVTPVGTTNTTGMANLGERPTRDQLMAQVAAKSQEAPKVPTETPDNTHTDAAVKEPVTPQPNAESLPPSKGIFGGLQQLAYNESEDMPLDFFTDDQIDEQSSC